MLARITFMNVIVLVESFIFSGFGVCIRAKVWAEGVSEGEMEED